MGGRVACRRCGALVRLVRLGRPAACNGVTVVTAVTVGARWISTELERITVRGSLDLVAGAGASVELVTGDGARVRVYRVPAGSAPVEMVDGYPVHGPACGRTLRGEPGPADPSTWGPLPAWRPAVPSLDGVVRWAGLDATGVGVLDPIEPACGCGAVRGSVA